MGPLGHLRVVDLSPNRVGAQVSQFFADFGADVICVEPPGGAETRREAAFPFWARGKRSIVLDLHDAADREVVKGLARRADVLIATQVDHELDALGLGHADLAADNPRLVYASISSFGDQGPYAAAPFSEGLVMAKLGVYSTFTRMSPTGEPPFVTAPFASFAASQVALHGTLAALFERERSGAGQRVDTDLLRAFTTLDTWAWFEHLIAERWPEAFTATESYDSEGRPASPLTFMLLIALTADGEWLQFAAVAPHLFAAKMKALGLDWMFTDPDWAGLPVFDDPDRGLALWTHMVEAAKKKTLAEWKEVFEADHDVFAEQFRSGPGALDHPQLLHDGMVLELDDHERGVVRQPGALVKAAATPAVIDRSAPTLDQHRDEILAEIAGEKALVEPAVAAGSGLPLAGVTILELAVLFAAPHGTTMLTDLGARVIKVESLDGDMIRNIIPFPESGGAKVMQGKDSICVDLSTPDGLAVVQELLKDVDVVIQGWRAGAAGRLGLDHEGVKKINPDVVYVNAPGYGVDGPYGDRPAYAPSIGAASGIPLANGGETVPRSADLTVPEIQDAARRLGAMGAMANAQADGFAALGVTTAILFGLVARDAGAGGQELFSSMLNTSGHAMSAQNVSFPGAPPAPAPDAELWGLGPLYRIYPAGEGHVFLSAQLDGEWEPLVDALGVGGLADDPRFTDREARAANADALGQMLAGVFATRPATAWEAELLAAGIGCVALHPGSIEQKLFDPEFGRAGGYVADVVHPTFDEHPRLAPFVRFSRSSTQALPGVLAGQSTDKLLAEIGRSAAEIADLRDRSIVG